MCSSDLESQLSTRATFSNHDSVHADGHHHSGALVFRNVDGNADWPARTDWCSSTLLIFHQPFGFNAILGLIGLSGILMRNTLILIGQIHSNQADGLDPYHAIIEATVQRSRPVILTALAAVLAFIPLTHSVFWGSMAYVLIGGTAVGTVLTLAFLPALYAIWFRVRHVAAAVPIMIKPALPVADLVYVGDGVDS